MSYWWCFITPASSLVFEIFVYLGRVLNLFWSRDLIDHSDHPGSVSHIFRDIPLQPSCTHVEWSLRMRDIT